MLYSNVVKNSRIYFTLIILSSLNLTCQNYFNKPKETAQENVVNQDSLLFLSTMQNHLDAVSNKDLETLKTTLSPNGEMQLILPGEEIIHTSAKFLEFHEEWFKETTWTFETKILNTAIGQDFGMAITEIVYREPYREGMPYFNRMI
ncbi:MAG: hypothetical protein ACSHXF_14105 [Aquaticitalea sp.]